MLDFADPGDIGVYVSPEFLEAREPSLLAGQCVHGGELAGAFASLRANDLVWNYVISNYLKGETPPAFDLLYWNGDSSNLPGPWYVYYLRNMYIDNKLREPGALTMAGAAVDLSRITLPAYVYASRDDHIVPWRSGLSDHATPGRRFHVRPRRLGPHRRRGQSAPSAAPQLLGQRSAYRYRGRLAGTRRQHSRQLVAPLARMAGRPWRSASCTAGHTGKAPALARPRGRLCSLAPRSNRARR